jgi:hypothetical protein
MQLQAVMKDAQATIARLNVLKMRSAISSSAERVFGG